MKRNKHSSKSVENKIKLFINNNKTDENSKTSRIATKRNLTNNNSSFIIIQDKNKYLIEKNYTQQMPASNFLEEMYIKYSKNLQKYFLKNQTGLKLAGNKYFQNLTVEEYIKQHNLTKEQFIQLLNGRVPLDNKVFTNNKNLEKIKKEQFFLTPIPNKSRQLLNTNKEKSDFLEAERAAVVMRTFEYTHGIKSKVGIYEYKKIMSEQKQRLINLMLNAAQKIQRWWKKKYYYISKNRSDENFNKKLMIYNDMLNKKKAKYFFDKVENYIKYLLKPKRKFFLKKLRNKAKNSMRKIYTIYDWYNSMKICSEIVLQIDKDDNIYFIKRKKENINKSFGFVHNFFITKKLIFSKNNDKDSSNTEIYQIKKIIFIQKVFKQFLKLQKEKETYRKGNKTQFSYINPNKILFLFNKSSNSEAKESKSFIKTKRNNYSSKNNYELNKNNKNQNGEILIEEDEKTIRGNLPSISPLSKNKSENDDIDKGKNQQALLNKKDIVSNIKKKLDDIKENPNKKRNFSKINLNNNKSIKTLNNKKIQNSKHSSLINKIMNRNNLINNNIKNKSYNNDKNNNNTSKEVNKINKNNGNKNIFKKIENKKINNSSNIYNNQSEKNSNLSSNYNKIDSKNNKKYNLVHNKVNDIKHKIINSNNNNEFNLNSSSNINKQISFGIDNTPSEIIKKNNINSFFDNEIINNNSSYYYNLNNKEDSNNKNNIPNYKKIKALKNNNLPQKKSFLNNLLGIEENELSLINKKNKNENKNSLLLIDSLEIENDKKIDKNIIKVINSNENFEKSLPPEINLDNYQQDSTLDYRDKRIKSNQKTISTSAILRLDTSNNKNYESIYNYQIVGQICLNYIHRPNISGDSYISKIRKNYFSSKINKSLFNLLNIKNSFSFSKLLFNNNINKSIIFKKYFNHWKNIMRKESEPFTYSKTITSICTVDNNDKGEYFSYYSKINKSNQENDFVFLRITLGYKLLRKLFCGNDLKIFFYLLKKRRRRKNRAKTYIYKKHSKNILNLLDFKIKLPILLNKIIIKKYCGIFYHKFLYFSLSLSNNIEYDLDNNKVCSLIREGYRKGYFRILYNILRERFSFEYYNTGLKFESFIKNIFSLHQ